MWRLMGTDDNTESSRPGQPRRAATVRPWRHRTGALLAGLFASYLTVMAAQAQGFADPLQTPALQYVAAFDRLPMQALVSRGGESLVAVGMRGVILRSDNGGASWQQVPVPVGSDLLAASFVSANQGWAAGHDGVILATADGGQTWSKQLDGRQALEQLTRYYRDDAQLDAQVREDLIRQLEVNLKPGPVLPFLSVLFVDADHGLASGPFGMLVATDDGGHHWRPALHQIDNPDFYHLNSISRIGERLFITSEQGIVFIASVDERQFRPLATGHVGSFFSLAGNGSVILAGGLGGVLYGSRDSGEHWAAIESPLSQLVTRITFDAQSQRFIAVSAGGELLSLGADLGDARLLKTQAPMLYTDVVSLPGKLVFAGIQGIAADSSLSLQAQQEAQP